MTSKNPHGGNAETYAAASKTCRAVARRWASLVLTSFVFLSGQELFAVEFKASEVTPSFEGIPHRTERAAVASPTNPLPTIRIKAGIKKPFTDDEGNDWLPDQGFTAGVIADRDVITPISNTKTPNLYRSEHYGMTAFARSVPNGRYEIRLHFAEMYEKITGPGQRVFSFTVEGREFKDLDIWAAAGGSRRALIETVVVDVKDGKLDITFVGKVQYPVISAIEIIPIEGEQAAKN